MSFKYLEQNGATILNSISQQILGEKALTAESTLSDFISVGETITRKYMDNLVGEIEALCATRVIEAKRYSAKLKILQDGDGSVYNNRVMKVKFYPTDGDRESAHINIGSRINHANGYDNGTNSGNSLGSMWEQKITHSFTMNYGNHVSWDKNMTFYRDELKEAMRSPEELTSYVAGKMAEYKNDVEIDVEGWARLTMLNRIAGVYNLATRTNNKVAPESAVNMTALFNDVHGTSYTSVELRTDYKKDFCEFLGVTLKRYSDWLTHRSSKFHWAVPQTFNVVEDGVNTSVTKKYLTWTDKSNQRALLFKDIFEDLEAEVLPEVYHPEKIFAGGGYEMVDYWQRWDTEQSANGDSDRPKISVTPAIPDTVNFGTSSDAGQVAGDAVALDYVIGVIYEKDSCKAGMCFKSSDRTPMEARKKYYNIWETWVKQSINDFTEQAVVFYMAD